MALLRLPKAGATAGLAAAGAFTGAATSRAGAAGAACGAAATACDDRTAGLAGVVPRARSAASNGAVVTAGDVGRGGTARRPSVNEAGGFALCSTADAGPNPGLTAPPSASAAGLAH